MSVAIIDCINSRKGIRLRQVLIETNSAKIFSNVLQRITESLRDSAPRSGRRQHLRPISHRPQREQRPNAGHSTASRCIVRHKRKVAYTKRLPETFVICEQESFVFNQKDASRTYAHVAFEVR